MASQFDKGIDQFEIEKSEEFLEEAKRVDEKRRGVIIAMIDNALATKFDYRCLHASNNKTEKKRTFRDTIQGLEEFRGKFLRETDFRARLKLKREFCAFLDEQRRLAKFWEISDIETKVHKGDSLAFYTLDEYLLEISHEISRQRRPYWDSLNWKNSNYDQFNNREIKSEKDLAAYREAKEKYLAKQAKAEKKKKDKHDKAEDFVKNAKYSFWFHLRREILPGNKNAFHHSDLEKIDTELFRRSNNIAGDGSQWEKERRLREAAYLCEKAMKVSFVIGIVSIFIMWFEALSIAIYDGWLYAIIWVATQPNIISAILPLAIVAFFVAERISRRIRYGALKRSGNSEPDQQLESA